MTHHLHTGEAPSVVERHKTGFAGSLVEAESDCQNVPRGQRNGIGRRGSLKSCPGFLCRSKSCRSHHLHTDKALSVAERRKTGSAGGLVEAKSDFQSVPNYLSMENVENLIAKVCRKMRRDGEVNANYITTNSPRVCGQHSCRGKTI